MHRLREGGALGSNRPNLKYQEGFRVKIFDIKNTCNPSVFPKVNGLNLVTSFQR